MLDRVTMNEEFVVSVADIKARRALEAGTESAADLSNAPKKPPAATGRNKRR